MRWYVLHTHPRAELQACWHLRNQGFADVYLPSYCKLRRHARKIEKVVAPLFPRYLFVGMEIVTTQWRSIRSTIGIVDIIRNGDTPSPVPHGIVESIRAREDEMGLVAVSEESDFASGASVCVHGGPFNGCVGIFECVTDEERVVVLLDLLGRKVRVQVPLRAVVAAFA